MSALPLAVGVVTALFGVGAIIGAFIVRSRNVTVLGINLSGAGFWILLAIGIVLVLLGLLSLGAYFIQQRQVKFAREHPELLRLAGVPPGLI